MKDQPNNRRKEQVKDIFQEDIQKKEKKPNRFADVGNRPPNPEIWKDLFFPPLPEQNISQQPQKKELIKPRHKVSRTNSVLDGNQPRQNTTRTNSVYDNNFFLPNNPEKNLPLPVPFVGVGWGTFDIVIPNIVRECSPGAVLVYLALYRQSYGSEEMKNYCNASINCLANQTGLGTTAVKIALKSLQEKKFISRFERDLGRQGNLYLIGRYLSKTENVQDEKRLQLGQNVSKIKTENVQDDTYNNNLNINTINNPHIPLEKGEIKIKSEKFPRNPIVWEPWPTIREQVRGKVEEKDFESLYGVDQVALGKPGSIHVKGYYLKSPTDISEALRNALEEELGPYGITEIKIAV